MTVGSNNPLAAIIFDMDGLLVDSEPVAAEALRTFLLGHGRKLTAKTLEGTLGRRLPEAIAVVAAAHDLPGPLDDLVTTYARMRLEALRGNVAAMPGAAALLDWVRASGLASALATSSDRAQADVSLAEAGLAGRFDVMVTGDEVRHGKPAPDLFLLAAERLRVRPAACLVFEDAPAGLEAAARAGMRRVWVPNAHTRHLCPVVSVDAKLESLVDAIPWLATTASAARVPGTDAQGT